MTIAPIVRTIDVKAAPARAFDLFVHHMSQWWPKGKTPGGPHEAIVVEPHAGGRWFERNADGQEAQWGTVLAYEPPSRLLLGWQLNGKFAFDPDLLTEVEFTFVPAAGGGTRITLEHRNLERFGADTERLVAAISSGWPARLAEFVAYADTHL